MAPAQLGKGSGLNGIESGAKETLTQKPDRPSGLAALLLGLTLAGLGVALLPLHRYKPMRSAVGAGANSAKPLAADFSGPGE